MIKSHIVYLLCLTTLDFKTQFIYKKKKTNESILKERDGTMDMYPSLVTEKNKLIKNRISILPLKCAVCIYFLFFHRTH